MPTIIKKRLLVVCDQSVTLGESVRAYIRVVIEHSCGVTGCSDRIVASCQDGNSGELWIWFVSVSPHEVALEVAHSVEESLLDDLANAVVDGGMNEPT